MSEKYYLAAGSHGWQIMKVTFDKDKEPVSWDPVQDEKGEPMRFEFMVDAYDHCVLVGIELNFKEDDADWDKMRVQKEETLRRQRHEDLPLFRKD